MKPLKWNSSLMTGLSTTNKIILGALRYSIASVLLLSGLGKLLDVPGFVQVLITYHAIPAWGLHLVAVTLVLVELRDFRMVLSRKYTCCRRLGITCAAFYIYALDSGDFMARSVRTQLRLLRRIFCPPTNGLDSGGGFGTCHRIFLLTAFGYKTRRKSSGSRKRPFRRNGFRQ